MKAFVRAIKRRVIGAEIEPSEKLFLANEQRQRAIAGAVSGKTMIGLAGILANLDAVDYVVANRIPGAIVECGVWRGGSVAAMLMRLLDHGIRDRDVYLFDTFAGMTAPTDEDKRGETPAVVKFKAQQKEGYNDWCYSSLDEVKTTILATGYPAERVHYVVGDVLKTLPQTSTGPIALLRLDTDWYESTKAEFAHLYPLVSAHGVVAIDDYGSWDGARKAADEFLATLTHKPLLLRVDMTRRMFVKTA